ncbi:NTP transferase domain-containing protein [Candidatus Desantisbacteria bacterium]|nr:NTP transferase domain-containing protein [Candidatus Desantisbacteria bacterium]
MGYENIGTIILAAGLGKRMKSKLIKILHPICGQPMVAYVIDALDELGIKKRVIVLGHQREQVAEFLSNRSVEIAIQERPLGTGDAVKSAEQFFDKYEGDILILSGDTPLISTKSIERLIATHRMSKADTTILTVEMQNPTGYGRIVKDNEGYILRIVEERDATPEERGIKTVNTGTYCFKAAALFSALKMVSSSNAQEEYYLTDVFEIINSQGGKIASVSADSPVEVMGINSRKELAVAESYMRRQILDNLMDNGVTIISPETVFIDKGVKIGQDTVIYPFTTIEGQSVIGEDCVIGPHACLMDATVRNGARVIGNR